MSRSLLVGSLLGAGALLSAIAVAVFEPPLAQLAIVGTDWVVFAVASAAIALGVAGLVRANAASTAVGAASLPARSAAPSREHRRISEALDRTLERPELGETTVDAGRRSYQRRQAREAIHRAVRSTLAGRHGVSSAEADQRLGDGSWTDDPRAAAYVSADVSLPLRLRLQDWAHGARRQRGLEAAIEEVDALAAEGPGGEAPRPETARGERTEVRR